MNNFIYMRSSICFLWNWQRPREIPIYVCPLQHALIFVSSLFIIFMRSVVMHRLEQCTLQSAILYAIWIRSVILLISYALAHATRHCKSYEIIVWGQESLNKDSSPVIFCNCVYLKHKPNDPIFLVVIINTSSCFSLKDYFFSTSL
jgi:hypothetical protein